MRAYFLKEKTMAVEFFHNNGYLFGGVCRKTEKCFLVKVLVEHSFGGKLFDLPFITICL